MLDKLSQMSKFDMERYMLNNSESLYSILQNKKPRNHKNLLKYG